MADWLVEPRTYTGFRTEDPIALWSALTVVERLNRPGPWSLAGPATQLAPLMTPGMGVVLSRSGLPIMSGQVTSFNYTGDGNAQVSGWDDKMWLGGAPADDKGRIITPDPTKDITAQVTDTTPTYTSAREDLIVALVAYHAGPLALPARRVPRLRTPGYLGRGGTVVRTIKMELLHTVVQELAEAGQLIVNVVHTEDGSNRWLDLTITPQVDVSSTVRFGPASQGGAGVLGDDWSYTVSGPSMTAAIVGGTSPPPQVFGDGDSQADDPGQDLRQYRQVTNGLDAWGVRQEGFVDASSTNTAAELDQAGTDALADAAAKREVSASIVDTPDVGYGVDWRVGYRVGVTVAGQEGSDVVREVSTTVQSQQGQQTEQISAAIGWSQATTITGPAAVTTRLTLLGLLGQRRAYKSAVWR